jgi:Zn-dependent protease
MIFFLFNLFTRDPLYALQLLPIILLTFGGALLAALTVHEFGHALVANQLGDRTARSLGRLSLNPVRHLDPMGTLMFLFVGFGWGKPVPVDPATLQRGRQGMALVALAGPGGNFALAALLALATRLLSLDLFLNPALILEDLTSVGTWLGVLAAYGIFYNLVLGVFNLIPLAPLDGSKVAIGLAPRDLAYQLMRLEPYGPMVLLLIIGADIFFNLGILGSIIFPPVVWLSRVLTGVPFVG